MASRFRAFTTVPGRLNAYLHVLFFRNHARVRSFRQSPQFCYRKEAIFLSCDWAVYVVFRDVLLGARTRDLREKGAGTYKTFTPLKNMRFRLSVSTATKH